MSGGAESYAFGEFVVDVSTFELRRDGQPVPLEPKVFDVLLHLLRARGRVVSKEELLDQVWGDRFVSESALSSQIRHVRRALGDDGRRQGFIRTVHGRGYQFVADVAVTGSSDARAAVDSGATPGGDGGEASRGDLPAERTPLLGRDREVATVATLVTNHRLVSLLGIGGAGKTRLGVASARAATAHFADGAAFVDLVPTDDESSVQLAIAAACGLALGAGPPLDQITALLAQRHLLLVLDNCEHVLGAVTSSVDRLLDRAARLHVLATSREPLGVAGERRVRVTPLTAGDGEDPAIALFVATAERLGVVVADDELGTVAAICDSVDRLPLAIELAAGQLRLLTPAQVLERLHDPLRLLNRPESGDDRHASMHAVLRSTWESLDDDDIAVLGRLAAFPAAIELADADDAATSVGTDPMRVLARLADRSLVTPNRAEPPRLQLADTVRHFVHEHTDRDANADWLAEWCLATTGTDALVHVCDLSQAWWCSAHADALRTSEQHLLAGGRSADAASLTTATALAAHSDTGSYASSVLGRVDHHVVRTDDPQLLARLHCTGVLAAMAARAPQAIAAHGVAARAQAERAGTPVLQSIALVLESWSTVLVDREAALDAVEQASALAGDVGAQAAVDLADAYRSFHLAMGRRYDEALAQADDVVGRADPEAPPQYGTLAAIVAATACRVLDAPDDATRWLDVLVSSPALIEPMWGNEILAAAVHASAGRAAEAARYATRVRRRSERAGRSWLPDLLVPAAMLAHRLDDDDRARRWLAAVKSSPSPTQSFQVTLVYRRLRERVGPLDAAAGAATEGSLDEVGDEALAWMTSLTG